jgi:hypothetical protein
VNYAGPPNAKVITDTRNSSGVGRRSGDLPAEIKNNDADTWPQKRSLLQIPVTDLAQLRQLFGRQFFHYRLAGVRASRTPARNIAGDYEPKGGKFIREMRGRAQELQR